MPRRATSLTTAPVSFAESVKTAMEPYHQKLTREGLPDTVFTAVVDHLVAIYPTIRK
jgi:hypothetical protein